MKTQLNPGSKEGCLCIDCLIKYFWNLLAVSITSWFILAAGLLDQGLVHSFVSSFTNYSSLTE